MYILHLALFRYQRLVLSDINKFEMDCSNPEQIIIGTNGSGKSSIMQELTPYPAHRRNYSKGGYKVIYIRHKQSVYKLISDFKSGNNHEFWIAPYQENYRDADYENLNPGRTYTVQIKLVEDHFKLDSNLIDLFLSKEKFTDMSIARRKEWIVRLSGGDLDYAIKVHRGLLSKVTESTTIVKHLKKRIAEESTRLISIEELNTLEGLAKTYNEELTKLYNSGVDRTNYNLDDLQKQIDNNLRVINQFTKNVSGKKLAVPLVDGNTINTIEELRSYIYVLNDRDSDLNNQLNRLYQETTELRKWVDEVVNSKSIDISSLENEVLTITNDYHRLIATLNIGDYGLLKPDINQVKALYDSLNEITMSMIDNSNKNYTRDICNTTKEARIKLVDRLTILHREQTKWEHRLEHIKSAKQEECPNCNHKWFPGIENGSEEYTLNYLSNINAEILSIDKQIFEIDEYLDCYNTFAKSANLLGSLIKSNPIYQDFWNYLLEKDLWFMKPTELLNHIYLWYTDMQTLDLIETNDKRMNQIQTLINEYNFSKGLDVNNANNSISIKEKEINDLLAKKEHNKSLLISLKTYDSHYESTRQNYEAAIKESKKLNQLVITYLEQIATNIVNEQITNYQTMLAHTNSALQSANSINAIISSLENNLTISHQQLEIRETLAKALDPKMGLIADYIRKFIELFIEQLNDIIAKPWTVPMEIMPCGFNDSGKDIGDLNYRFPVTHNNGMSLSPDIADNSSAQKDMINFAFVLTVYLYLDLEEYPLWIDELAPTMDELHRININNFVKMLIDSNRHSQLFMISHYLSGYGVYQNADICMLSDLNILNKPERYNEHIVIK